MTDASDSDMLSEVLKVDKDHDKRDEVYKFTGGRKFEDSDDTDSGFYDGN